jgi:tetratricopeptide (TPR) repeat protein
MTEHPPDDLLRHFAAGTASRAEGRQITAHLLRGCRACADRVQELLHPGVPGDAYDAVFARLERSPRRGAGAPSSVDAEATKLLAELDDLPTLRQEILARNSRRYLSPDLAHLLAQRSFDLRYQDPRPMLRSARMALGIADRLESASPDEAKRIADLRALCASQVCHAHRIAGDFAAAEQALAVACAALSEGTGDPAVRAMTFLCIGTLRQLQCRYEASMRAYQEAAEIFRDLGKPHDLARALIGEAIVLLYAGDPEAALSLLFEAIPKIEGEREPRLTLSACHNIVSAQIDAGLIDDASLKWIELRFLYEKLGDPLLRLREKWLEGKLMIAQGVIPAGIRLLEKARDAYRERGLLYDAAVIALEIAQGHLRLGHRDRVQSLIAEIVPVLRDMDVSTDVLTAFVHLRRAAQQEKLRWPATPPG